MARVTAVAWAAMQCTGLWRRGSDTISSLPMEDMDTASLSADVETVLLASAQTSDFSRNIPCEDEPGLDIASL